MSEQGSECDGGVNPGQEIYDGLSDEAKAVVDALPDDLFEDDEGVDHAQRIVRSIRIAHQLAPDSWALVTFQEDKIGFVALNITGENAISLGDKLRFVVQRDLVNDQDLGTDLQPFITWEKYRRRDYLVQVGVDSGTTSNARGELNRVHDLTLKRLAKGKIGLHGRNHRDDIRLKLALLTGEDIPAPGYVPETTYGIAYGMRRKAALLSESVSHAIQPTLSDDAIKAAVKSLPDRFSAVGLKYTEAQIASFYTALQTKGFVILSGISGTGKSKIAQRFADMLPQVRVSGYFVDGALDDNAESDDYHKLRVRKYMPKFKILYIPTAISSYLPLQGPGTAFNVPIKVNDVVGEARLKVSAKGATTLLPKALAKQEFVSLVSQGDAFFIRFSLTEDADLVEGVQILSKLPDNGTTRNGQGGPVEVPNGTASLSLTEATTLSNHLFLSVRPDWRDGKALIGYHNPLSGEYQRTQFLDFVIAAGDDYTAGNRNAFFVILDEMNLAHVEYYFADVLSVIESGRDKDGWSVEGISLSIGEADADLPETLKLPPNLYIVGTVNMDETTHPFSPKVLDRAFTIELTEVDFIGYPPDKSEASESGDDDKQALLRTFTQNGRYPRIDKGDIREVVDRPERFGVDLQSLNLSLRRSRMHFGYRVFDEIMQFVFNAEENGLFTSDEAFDHAVLMKVLPKFNGSRAKLQTALFELLHWCHKAGTMSSDDRADLEARFAKLTDDHTSFDTVVPKDSEAVEDQWRYPATGRRAALMMQDLYTDGFAAFG